MDRQESAVRRYWTGFWSHGDPAAALEFYAPRFMLNGAEETAEAFASASLAWREHFSGFSARVDEVIVCDDRVISRTTFGGTHQGAFETVPVTGRSIEVSGIDVFRFRDGRVVEHWREADHCAMFVQLGAKPRLDAAPVINAHRDRPRELIASRILKWMLPRQSRSQLSRGPREDCPSRRAPRPRASRRSDRGGMLASEAKVRPARERVAQQMEASAAPEVRIYEVPVFELRVTGADQSGFFVPPGPILSGRRPARREDAVSDR